jgi:hypothetical protein
VTETTVGADLLQALEILTELGVDTVGDDLEVLAIGNVTLSVEEPGGDLVLRGVLDDGDNTLEFFGGDFTSAVILISTFVSQKEKKVSFVSKHTACSDQHRPSCRPSWSNDDQHP